MILLDPNGRTPLLQFRPSPSKTSSWKPALIIVDRKPDLAEWVEVLKTVHKRKIQILAFANNHYAGYGPGTIEQFRKLWQRQVGTETGSKRSNERAPEDRRLFD